MQPDQLNQLISHLNWQARKLVQLEHSIQEVLKQLETLRQQQKPTVDKIEYNFDQLKIEKLEGTLNIGISPDKGNTLEDLSVNGQTLEEQANNGQSAKGQPQNSERGSDYFTHVQKAIYHYLDTELPGELHRLMAEHEIRLEAPEQAFIIDDLRKQVDDRILHYLSGSHPEGEQTIFAKVKRDIWGGLEQYLSHLHENGVKLDEFYSSQ